MNATVTELDKAAVGAVLGKLRTDGLAPKPLSVLTVYRYWKDPEGVYADNPFPQPRRYRGRTPVWESDQIPDIEAWARARKGQGAGGGRPWTKPTLDDGYIPCSECRNPIERHDRFGCHPIRGTCECTQTHWTPAKIRGARLAAGLDERYDLEGSTV